MWYAYYRSHLLSRFVKVSAENIENVGVQFISTHTATAEYHRVCIQKYATAEYHRVCIQSCATAEYHRVCIQRYATTHVLSHCLEYHHPFE